MKARWKIFTALVLAVSGTFAHSCSPPAAPVGATDWEPRKAFFAHIAGKYQFTALVLGDEDVQVQVSEFGTTSMVTVGALRVRITESAHAEVPVSKEFTFYGWRQGSHCQPVPESLVAPIGATVRLGTNDLKTARLLK